MKQGEQIAVKGTYKVEDGDKGDADFGPHGGGGVEDGPGEAVVPPHHRGQQQLLVRHVVRR